MASLWGKVPLWQLLAVVVSVSRDMSACLLQQVYYIDQDFNILPRSLDIDTQIYFHQCFIARIIFFFFLHYYKRYLYLQLMSLLFSKDVSLCTHCYSCRIIQGELGKKEKES